MILCDTNILIEFYKDNPVIKATLAKLAIADLGISVITAGELYFGARDKRELRQIQQHLTLLQMYPVDAATSTVFINLLTVYALSHRLSLPDALIAATALQNQLPLYTLNTKDFRFIDGLQLYQP